MKKKRLLIYFCICLALFVLLGVAFFYLSKLNALENYSNRVDHSYRVIIHMGKLEKKLLDAETGQRGFIITNDSIFLEPYSSSHQEILEIFQELDTLTRDNPEQQMHLDTLKALIMTTTSLLKENMSQFSEKSMFVDEFEKGRYYMNKIRKSMENLKRSETELLQDHDNNKKLNSNSSKTSSYILLVIAFGACCIGAVGIVKYFNESMRYQFKLRDTIYKLKVLNKEILDLTFASSHNLQEPMRKIQLIIDKTEHFRNSEEQVFENLNRIKQIYAEQQITNNVIVDYYDILNTSTQKELVSIETLIAELAKIHHWDDQLQINIGSLPKIQVDPYQIKLLLTNLIQNSIGFNKGNTTLKVDIYEVPVSDFSSSALEIEGKNYTAIAFSDNGIGVSSELHRKIFELFQKIEDADNADPKRKGMGLSFSKRIMLNHNGWILAENNQPSGLTIILFFPNNEKL